MPIELIIPVADQHEDLPLNLFAPPRALAGVRDRELFPEYNTLKYGGIGHLINPISTHTTALLEHPHCPDRHDRLHAKPRTGVCRMVYWASAKRLRKDPQHRGFSYQ